MAGTTALWEAGGGDGGGGRFQREIIISPDHSDMKDIMINHYIRRIRMIGGYYCLNILFDDPACI